MIFFLYHSLFAREWNKRMSLSPEQATRLGDNRFNSGKFGNLIAYKIYMIYELSFMTL